MKDFAYTRASNSSEAFHLLDASTAAKFLAGGTNLLDLMRQNIEQPDHLVDVRDLPFRDIQENNDGSVSIGAFVKNSVVAGNSKIRQRFPLLSQSILFSAWARRNPQPRSHRDGSWLVGQGVASAYYPALCLPAAARVRVSADGTATVYAAANEMGMGVATSQLQHSADRLGLPIDCVEFNYGDSQMPASPMAGGSCQTLSIVASVRATVEKLHRELLKLEQTAPESPLKGARYEDIVARDGSLFRASEPSRGATYVEILRRAGKPYLESEGAAPMSAETIKYSIASYGAQFCEVRVNEITGEIRVARWLGSFDCGTILNPKTAISQLRGGIVMGIGMALSEEVLFDERTGRIMNASLGDYHVPVNLDVPHIDVLFNDIPDPHTPLGAHGIGEIGITGAAAAIANAIYNATGKRIRSLPITLDKLL